MSRYSSNNSNSSEHNKPAASSNRYRATSNTTSTNNRGRDNNNSNDQVQQEDYLNRGRGTHNRPWMSQDGTAESGTSGGASGSSGAAAATTHTQSSSFRARSDPSRDSAALYSSSSSRYATSASAGTAPAVRGTTVSRQERSESAQADQLVQAYLQRRSSRDEEDATSDTGGSSSSVQTASSSSYARYLQQKQSGGSAASAVGGSGGASSSDYVPRRQTSGNSSVNSTSDRPIYNRSSVPVKSRSSNPAAAASYDTLTASVQGVGRPPRRTSGNHSNSNTESIAAASVSTNTAATTARRSMSYNTSGMETGASSSSPRSLGQKSWLKNRQGSQDSGSNNGDNDDDDVVETSRELRARRLREQSRSDSRSRAERSGGGSSDNESVTESSKAAAPPPAKTHFQAHSPLVEKYLTRSKMIEGNSSASAAAPASRPPPVAAPAPPPPPAAVDPKDETKKSHDSAVRGWSTLSSSSSRRSSSASNLNQAAALNAPDPVVASNVDEYLALRNAQKHSPPPIPAKAPIESDVTPYQSSGGFTTEESESEEVSESDSDDDESDMETNGPEWCLRATVVSAVDFPTNVVPNLPFAPVLKVALVKLPSQGENPQGEEAASKLAAQDSRRRELASAIESKGLSHLPRARIRSTSSKILSKRDNGSVEFHEEMRWDRLQTPTEMVLVVELSARAVMAPLNARESPCLQSGGSNKSKRPPTSPSKSPSRPGSDVGSDGGMAGIGALWRKKGLQRSGSAEMETANAAAAVAQLLVGGEKDPKAANTSTEEGTGPLFDSKPTSLKSFAGSQSEMDVKLRPRKFRKRRKMTEDIRLGSQIVPLSKLPLAKAMSGKQSARIEQWIELDTLQGAFPVAPSGGRSPSAKAARRNPSILMEISFSTPELMDDSEDDMDEDDDADPKDDINASFSKRASMKIRSQLKDDNRPQVEVKDEEPVLLPGVIDFIAVVGARDIGSQTKDDGSKGWVSSTPECCLLEQYPPTDDFHVRSGRSTVLPNKVEWFCFPEGVKLWRGEKPPTPEDLNLTRFSASSPPNVATSIAAFDACLGCTTSFTWFVIASNSDSYGSESVKTYGAVIRFYVPAPAGIDPTQDDFAQTMMGGGKEVDIGGPKRRLWVPIGICLTTSLPIVGIMETMLMRLCKELGSTQGAADFIAGTGKQMIYDDLKHVIFNYQKPIRGIVQCSVPFLTGERLHIGLPSPTGLPPLPHGNSIVSACRLLGADGLNFLLAAFLTECKIVIHSNDVANLCLVAEVITALLYPFSWSLPYVPVLPAEMMEFIEAPLSYLLGVPSCNVNLVDPSVFEDVVLVDLDKDFSSSGYYEGRRTESSRAKAPSPLPATTAGNISKAVYRLLRAEEEVEEAIGNSRSFPRMEPESLAEREFRLAVALEVTGLIKGYEDNLVFASSSQPVFNGDKFLQTAPALFEQQRGASTTAISSTGESNRVLSPRSKRFLSQLINCQHFHQLLETLHTDKAALFHEMMGVLKAGGKRKKSQLGGHFSGENKKTIEQLNKYMQKREDKIPTYRVKRNANENIEGAGTGESLLLRDLLQPIVLANGSSDSPAGGGDLVEGTVKSLSLEYLVELEKTPWCYRKLFEIEVPAESDETGGEQVKLREAIGERRYRAWKAARDRKRFDSDDLSIGSDDSGSRGSAGSTPLDLKGLLTFTDETPSDAPNSIQQRIADAKDRDALRRCLERAWAGGNSTPDAFVEKGRNLVTEAEAALRNPSAQRFLCSVLKKRSRVEGQSPAADQEESSRASRRSGIMSKLEPPAFEVLVRLGCAMLDACMEAKSYETAYNFLKHTAGLYTNAPDNSDDALVYMTARIGQHPIFADLGVWERVKELHISAHQDEKGGQVIDKDDAEYEAAKATLYEMLGYGIPAEELARFVSRVSETNGWFQSERGKTLLLLARRLSVRREQGADSAANPATTSDLAMMSPKPQKTEAAPKTQPAESQTVNENAVDDDDGQVEWAEIGWCHPAAKSSRRLLSADKSRRAGAQSSPEEVNVSPGKSSGYMKRSAVTSLAYLGSSVVVTGGLDGGVFMARKVKTAASDHPDAKEHDRYGVYGVHLDWGSSGSRYTVGSSSTSLDGEYGVGSVACLAATRGAEHHYSDAGSKATKDVSGPLDDEDLLRAMEGNRVVAGTTCGDLRVWSVKDVFAAVFYSSSGGGDAAHQHEGRLFHRGEGASSGFIGSRRKAVTDFAAGSSLTRLKFSLRGRALSGHRGGVSCIDVPSNVYRPDSIVSGGADGLIKLWSLRAPGASVGRRNELDKGTTQLLSPGGAGDTLSPRTKAARNGDALSILSGHGGRVLTVKTAWHGDRLLSGGADRTVRVWDLAGSGGKCLHTLSGHFGWVTAVHYWGPNTIISASTDRSIALWDARVRSSPLFTLRHHHAPVSDLLVGSRTDPIMVSAASDGTIAAWDFRHLSDTEQFSAPINYATAAAAIATPPKKQRQVKVVRYPAAKLYMHDVVQARRHVYGPVLLTRSCSSGSAQSHQVQTVGGDAVVREWDYQSGNVVAEHATGHCDAVSQFRAISGDVFCDSQLETAAGGGGGGSGGGGAGNGGLTGTITTSWDGTVRMRTRVRK